MVVGVVVAVVAVVVTRTRLEVGVDLGCDYDLWNGFFDYDWLKIAGCVLIPLRHAKDFGSGLMSSTWAWCGLDRAAPPRPRGQPRLIAVTEPLWIDSPVWERLLQRPYCSAQRGRGGW
jgi:hypothetical protein